MELNDRLRELLTEAGAVAWGCAPAGPVEEEDWVRFQTWIEKGYHAGMEYMKNYPDIRRDPRLLLDGAKTVISTAFNYRQPNPYRGVATYALGQDYHNVLRKRLREVAGRMREEFGGDWRVCIDSAPILERYWAERCGIGKRSPVHGNIVVPGTGSMVFLAELITTLELECPSHAGEAGMGEPEMEKEKGVCPTGALQKGGVIDSRRCINYLTIEKREPLTAEEGKLVGNARFGCDVCQRHCLENEGSGPGVIPEFLPMDGLERFLEGEGSDFDLKKSPLARSKFFKKR